VRAAILAGASAVPAVFTALAVLAGAAGDVPGMLAAGLPAALGWAAWAFLAALVMPRRRARQARWSRKDAAELQAILGTAPKRGRR
jgi:hypothetical protein